MARERQPAGRLGIRGLALVCVGRRLVRRHLRRGRRFAAPRIGLASLITIGIAGQIVMAMFLDQVGALGLPRDPIRIGRGRRRLLVVAGVALVRRG